MTDLSEKFTAFEDQIHTQHEALMDMLSTMSDQLAAIAVALAPAPPPTVTLADVIAAIEAGNATALDSLARLTAVAESADAINTTVGDVHLDTMSMDGKLLTIRDDLADVHLDTQSIDQKLLRIRDAINPLDETLPGEGLTSIPWLLYRLVDAIAPEWPRTVSPAMQPGLAALIGLAALYLPEVALINDAIGVPTGDATTTVLGLLSSLQYSNSALVVGQQQLVSCGCPPTAEGCTNPYVSTGLWLAPFGLFQYESVIVATWPTPPTGITYGSYFGLGEDHTELYSDDWTGWSVFVESDQSQYSADTGTLRHPTNAWQAVPDGPGSYSFAVSARGALKVTLCPPDATPPPAFEGVGFVTVGRLIQNNGASTFASQGVAWDLSLAGAGNIFPTPNDGVGETLYIHNCGNNTENGDKSISILTDGLDPTTVFAVVPLNETITVTAPSTRFMYLWTYGRAGASGTGFASICVGWTQADAEAHCPE